jgi:hypothetical protein
MGLDIHGQIAIISSIRKDANSLLRRIQPWSF